MRGHPSALARTTLRKCAAVALAFGFAADHSDHFDDFDRHTFITKRFINVLTKMRAVFLALVLSIFDKTNSAAIDEDFGKFFNGARPFRRSENAKISDLAKGKRRKGLFKRQEFLPVFDEHVFKRPAQDFIGTSWPPTEVTLGLIFTANTALQQM